MLGHKWWRVIRIDRYNDDYSRSVAELRFINKENIESNDVSKVIGTDNSSNGAAAYNAFDSNNNSIAHSNWGGSRSDNGYNWWIGYVFDTPVNVTQLSILPRQDYNMQVWIGGDVEYSDDGVNWVQYGIFKTGSANYELALKIVPVFHLGLLDITPTGTTLSLNIYTQNEQGSITGTVKETGLPENAEVGLYDRKTRQLIAITRSVGGVYSFIGIDKNREYYVHAIDDHRQYNAVTQDMLMGNYDDMKAKGQI